MKSIFKIFIWLLCGFSIFSAKAQNNFSGWVIDHEGKPLIGATIQWKDSMSIGTASDVDGKFEVPRLDTVNGHILIIRHVSYAQVEVEIFPYENHLKLKVEADAVLNAEVEVLSTKRDAFSSTLNPINMENLSACELKRSACCSLAESFENNGTVNVSYSDAVTGAREIEMLGLRGIYTQMMVENRPTLNRLGLAYGMEYLPGSWIESIQVSKGASTVRNGVQGITGQINTEILKPSKAPPFYLNIYADHLGRLELNTTMAHRFNDKWSTGLLLHSNYFQTDTDHNHDMFLDIPKKKQINGLWRLFHESDLLHLEFNVQALYDSRFGGQTAKLFEHAHHSPTRLYEIENETRRLEAFGKVGYMGFDNPFQSIALVWSATVHDQTGIYGDRVYEGLQKSMYANLIFQTPLSANREHNLNAGVNYQMDDFTERFTDVNLGRSEQQSSVFAEYDFTRTINKEKGTAFAAIVGMRGDWVQTTSFQKIIPSPRINLKYNFNENLVLRASGGRGMRLPNLLIENIRYMPGTRRFVQEETVLPELAWSSGLNLGYNFRIGAREGNLNIDAYRTDFENQLMVDVDIAADEVHFYNLRGKSFANSLLITWTQDIIKGMELRLAYKFNDVRSTTNDSLRWQTFSPQHRGLLSLQYVTPNKGWQFNSNAQFTGPQRLPFLNGNTSDLPKYRQTAMAPAFILFSAQVTKYFKNGFEVYLGGKNLGNYKQAAPILGADNPFGDNAAARDFDATAVYGPIMGAMAYAGMRYTFKGKNKDKDKVVENEEHKHANGDEVNIRTSAQCGMCKTTIDEGLAKVEGVYHASLDMKTKMVNIHYDAKKTNPDALRKAISDLGYNADDMKRNEAVHEQLPDCCKLH